MASALHCAITSSPRLLLVMSETRSGIASSPAGLRIFGHASRRVSAGFVCSCSRLSVPAIEDAVADIDEEAQERLQLVAGLGRRDTSGGPRIVAFRGLGRVGEDLRHALRERIVQARRCHRALTHAFLDGQHHLLEKGRCRPVTEAPAPGALLLKAGAIRVDENTSSLYKCTCEKVFFHVTDSTLVRSSSLKTITS